MKKRNNILLSSFYLLFFLLICQKYPSFAEQSKKPIESKKISPPKRKPPPKKGKTTTNAWAVNQETLAIERAREMKLHYQNQSSHFPVKRKTLLIATFINASRVLSRDTFHQNLNTLANNHSFLDFAVIIYDGSTHSISQLCSLPKGIHRNPIIHCRRAVITFVPDHRSFPKLLLYPEVLPYLPNYQKALLIDEDISFSEVNISAFLSIWDCAFSSYQSRPPLIVQGLLAENTQHFHFLHQYRWKHWENLSTVIAAEVDFVEQQIPAFDALFLTWFIESVLPHAFSSIVSSENAWGPDFAWCGAARAFAKEFYEVYESPRGRNYTSCALIVKGGPFHHLNGHTINKRLKNQRFFIEGWKSLDLWKKLYPNWQTKLQDPTNSKFLLLKSYGISENCSSAPTTN